MMLRVLTILTVLAISSGTKIREIQVKTSGDPDSGFNANDNDIFTQKRLIFFQE